MEAIRKMRFGDESDLFGREKDDSFKGSIGNYVSLLPRQKQGPVLRRKEKNRGLHAGGADHHDCGVTGRGEGNDGERGDELYVRDEVVKQALKNADCRKKIYGLFLFGEKKENYI